MKAIENSMLSGTVPHEETTWHEQNPLLSPSCATGANVEYSFINAGAGVHREFNAPPTNRPYCIDFHVFIYRFGKKSQLAACLTRGIEVAIANRSDHPILYALGIRLMSIDKGMF